jgi:hypothetical protein
MPDTLTLDDFIEQCRERGSENDALAGWYAEAASIAKRYVQTGSVTPAEKPHDHVLSGCEYPCNIVAGTLEPHDA